VNKPLILASSSPYRRQLLARLTTEFVQANPDVDETSQAGESPEDLARRLAASKALALAPAFPNHLIIGSDQVAALDNQILTKPLTMTNAVRQLQAQSGRSVLFITALCLLNSASGLLDCAVSNTEVRFRQLTDDQIHRYLQREKPFDCAGSFKVEGLGIALFDAIASEDPTALIGLPLITLRRMLAAQGFELL